MSISFAKVSILGNAGGEPDYKVIDGGPARAAFSVAVNTRQKSKLTAEYVEVTHWFNAVAFDKLAEEVHDQIHKGGRLYFEGHLKDASWTDEATGEKRHKANIVLTRLCPIRSTTPSISFAKTSILGYAGGDPDFQILDSGLMVAKFSVAVNTRQQSKQPGKYVEVPNWFSVVAYEKHAEEVRDYVRKGDRVLFEGRLKDSTWADKTTGENRHKIEIVISDLCLGDSKILLRPHGKTGDVYPAAVQVPGDWNPPSAADSCDEMEMEDLLLMF